MWFPCTRWAQQYAHSKWSSPTDCQGGNTKRQNVVIQAKGLRLEILFIGLCIQRGCMAKARPVLWCSPRMPACAWRLSWEGPPLRWRSLSPKKYTWHPHLPRRANQLLESRPNSKALSTRHQLATMAPLSGKIADEMSHASPSALLSWLVHKDSSRGVLSIV